MITRSLPHMIVRLPFSRRMTGVKRVARGIVDHSTKTSHRKREKAQAEYLEDIGETFVRPLTSGGLGNRPQGFHLT
jgi:hypothetical protein